MPAVRAGHRPLVLGLELVVELLRDPLAQLGVERLDVEAGREPPHEREQQREVAQVGLDRLGHARVLDLDRDRLALVGHRAVDLADRGGRERLLLELGEDGGGLLPQLLAQQLLEPLERERRHVVAQLRQRLLEALALVLGQRAEVDRGEHLADLHRRTAHLPELLDQLARERRRPFARRLVRPLGRAHDVGGAGSHPASGLARHEAAEARGAGEAGGGRLARLVWHPSRLRGLPARRIIGYNPGVAIRAFGPGRVNLIGEHTDYNGGLALPFAIARGVTVELTPRDDGEIRADARDAGEQDAFPAAEPGRADGWRAFVRGTVGELRASGVDVPGADLAFSGDVPAGSGLSSSAALEAALTLALLALAGADEPDRVELARLCSRVENDWVGAETGLLDQLASLCCEEGGALRIDFATLALETVPLDLHGWQLATLDSGAQHAHAAGGYNARRAECREICARLGIEHVSRADPDEADALPEALARRARHVLTENARVDAMVTALRRGRPARGRAPARRLPRQPARRLRGERARGRGRGARRARPRAPPARGWSAAASAARC